MALNWPENSNALVLSNVEISYQVTYTKSKNLLIPVK